MQTLVLGTAQFGGRYGVTNTRGSLDEDDVAEVVGYAVEQGIHAVDTAASYGEAQRRLRPWAAKLDITTKVLGAGPELIRGRIVASLVELGLETADSCLLHDWHTLSHPVREVAASALAAAKAEGLVGAVGVSAYVEDDVATAGKAFPSLDIVQVPASAVDRRLDGSPLLAALHASGTRVQVRSVFLQGLLAAPSNTRQGRHPAIRAFHAYCDARGLSPLAVALGHVRALPWASEIVVGATGLGELEEILRAWSDPTMRPAGPGFASEDLDLVDPRSWGNESGL